MKRVLSKCKDIVAMSKLYEEVRIEFSKLISELRTGKPSPLRGKHLSKKHRMKISKRNRHRRFSEESRKKISESHRGKHHSEETRKKLSEANKGKPSPLRGRHHSEETRQKISKSCSGKYHWYTNGITSCKAKSCPEGFIAGRLRNANHSKS